MSLHIVISSSGFAWHYERKNKRKTEEEVESGQEWILLAQQGQLKTGIRGMGLTFIKSNGTYFCKVPYGTPATSQG